MRRVSWILSCVLAASTFGCSGTGVSHDSEPVVGQSNSALSTIYRTTIYSPPASDSQTTECIDVDLGPISDRTCFLTGIYGDFRGGPGDNGQRAEVHALPLDEDITTGDPGQIVYNRWIGRLCPGNASLDDSNAGNFSGRGLQATFACAPSTTANRVRIGVSGGATAHAAATPNRQCMLSGIGTTVDDFNRPDFNAAITVSDGTWQLTAGGIPGAGTDYAWAVCFDTTASASSFSEYRVAWSANISSDTIDELSCGLTGIKLGLYQWEYPSLGNGVDVQNIAGSGWWMDNTTTNGVTATCLE